MSTMTTAMSYKSTQTEFLTTGPLHLMRHKYPYRLQQEFQMHQSTGHFVAVRQDKVSPSKRFMASHIRFQIVLFWQFSLFTNISKGDGSLLHTQMQDLGHLGCNERVKQVRVLFFFFCLSLKATWREQSYTLRDTELIHDLFKILPN